MMRIAQEFSRFSGTYSQHNRIQIQVAKKLVSLLPEKSASLIWAVEKVKSIVIF